MTRPGRGLWSVAFVAVPLLSAACAAPTIQQAAPTLQQEAPTWSYLGTKPKPWWWHDLVNVPGAHKKEVTGSKVRIAIVDTGVDTGHGDLPKAEVVATCGETSAKFDDLRGHGTQLAGIALGKDRGQGGQATSGVAYGASLIAVKVDCGVVAAQPFTDGIDRALELNPDVVVIAIGGYPAGPPDVATVLADRIARSPNVLFVVASVWDNSKEYPFPTWTRQGNVVVVAAMMQVGGEEIPLDGRRGDVFAPGRDVETADIAQPPSPRQQFLMQGTSAAAAVVAGCAALVKEKSGLAGADLKNRLVSTAEWKPLLAGWRLECEKAVP